MKLLFSAFLLFVGPTTTTSFAPSFKQTTAKHDTALSMAMDRASFLQKTAFTAGTFFVATPSISNAIGYGANYIPQLKDVKNILDLSLSLDKLAAKASNPDEFETALAGLRQFNKDPNFYPGYARNFIGKSVLNNAEGDPRVGYVRQACSQIGSIQELLEGRQGLEGKAAADEAKKRVARAQQLLAKFWASSGLEGEETVKAFIAKHP